MTFNMPLEIQILFFGIYIVESRSRFQTNIGLFHFPVRNFINIFLTYIVNIFLNCTLHMIHR